MVYTRSSGSVLNTNIITWPVIWPPPLILAVSFVVMSKYRQHYSKDLKQRVVYQSLTLGYSTSEIARNLDMSSCVVRRTLQTWREIGDVVKDPKHYARQGRARLLDTGCTEVSVITLHPMLLQYWCPYIVCSCATGPKPWYLPQRNRGTTNWCTGYHCVTEYNPEDPKATWNYF